VVETHALLTYSGTFSFTQAPDGSVTDSASSNLTGNYLGTPLAIHFDDTLTAAAPGDTRNHDLGSEDKANNATDMGTYKSKNGMADLDLKVMLPNGTIMVTGRGLTETKDNDKKMYKAKGNITLTLPSGKTLTEMITFTLDQTAKTFKSAIVSQKEGIILPDIGTFSDQVGLVPGTINFTVTAAVPEPASIVTLTLGIGGLAAAGARRRRRAA
jgi:hypothetical protein